MAQRDGTQSTLTNSPTLSGYARGCFYQTSLHFDSYNFKFSVPSSVQ